MINTLNLLYAFKNSTLSIQADADFVYDGLSAGGFVYKEDATKSYVGFTLLNNDIERRQLANTNSEVMLNGIYQATCHYPKTQPNSDTGAMKLANQVRENYTQGLKVGDGLVVRSEISPQMRNDNFIYYVVSVYFSVIA